ncbi:glycoside hydrolase 43 family protein [Gracilinema caldarium]|uniref:Glycoside hydrolase family 43 n=1 Tax=Gracilinema caldarium (strain ATCC 51460 / DSM 7334 / H1) TaxID=744872 RepID=F8F4B6_GRAC1|nr:glycoside hydrolase 43 family protein [Gracilinema caldarium]AEJ20563.1 glycoside hydrolase family 43 [Gracilinema caldarium DSM 7334]
MGSVDIQELWSPMYSSTEYRNPILFADYSDPDVIRVGDRFFGTASSFVHTPGLPVLESDDLVHWHLVSYAIPRLPLYYDGPVRHGDGVWAPSLRYHDGWFWIFFSMPDEGIFMTRAKHPHGPWSPIHCIHTVQGWIDPCPFWDDDGTAYLVHAFAKSRCGIKSKLQLFQMKEDASALLGDGVVIFDGTQTQPTIEGPKLYKRNGYYYIFAPAGGVKPGWQTVLRAKSIWGPYEERIVLHQGDTEINGPHQGAYVALEDGTGWFIHFQDRDAYGRIWHLQPVQWINDWPLIGVDQNHDGIGEPVTYYHVPIYTDNNPSYHTGLSDDFDNSELSLQWQWEGNPLVPAYSLIAKNSCLRLFAKPCPGDTFWLYTYPNIITQKFPAPSFIVDVVFLDSYGDDVLSGLIVCGDTYYYIGVLKENSQYKVVCGQGSKESKDSFNICKVYDSSPFPITLRVTVDTLAHGRWYFTRNSNPFEPIGEPFSVEPGRWVGGRFGLFSISMNRDSVEGWSDIERVEVKI